LSPVFFDAFLVQTSNSFGSRSRGHTGGNAEADSDWQSNVSWLRAA